MARIRRPQKPIVPIIIGVILLVLALLTPGFLAGSRKSLMLIIGITTLDFLTSALAWILGILGVALIIYGGVFLAKGAAKSRLYAGPNAKLEEQLDDQMTEHPEFTAEIKESLRQLSRAEGSLDKFDKTIRVNAASSLQGARSGLEELVAVVINNIKHIRNTLMNLDLENYDSAKPKIRGILRKNNRALDGAADFIGEITDNISRLKAGDLAMLQAWKETLEDQKNRAEFQNDD